jgi:hypothetical protein
MNRKALIRNLLLGALITGLAPLSGAGGDPAVAAESPAALCRSMFGASGPVGGAVVGEGPSGDPMSTTIGWDPHDWSDGIREVITCVSVGGRAVPALTASTPTPRNDGSLVIRLTLPAGQPGSLVCEQSVLVGGGSAAGRHRTTSPVCFKLRAGESPLGSGVPAVGGVAAPAPPAPVGPPAPSPKAPNPRAPVGAAPPATHPVSTPPARAAFEAARGGNGTGVTRPGVPDPVAGVAVPAPAWPDPSSPARAARAGQSSTARGAASPATGAAPAPATGAAAAPTTGTPVATLARTGIDEQLPLASAGGFLALGGAAIIFSAPGRRRPRRRFV